MSKSKRKSRERRLTQLAQRRTNKTLSRKANAVAGQRLAQSQQAEQAASQLHDLLEGEIRRHAIGLFEKFDGMSGLRNATRRIAEMREEWAGIPMMLEDQELIIEPTNPYAEALTLAGAKVQAQAVAREEDEMNGVLPAPAAPEAKIRNVFWSWRWRAYVIVWEEAGKILWGPAGTSNQLGMQLGTLGASDAWGIEQESNAVKLLGTLVRHRQFKQYMLTGMFLERSKRSGVHYLFRRLRPTVAMSDASGTVRALCALCLHPIGYYSESHAGAMCPTDEIIAHLMLMRGDEHMLWRRANQHAPWRKEAAL